MIPVLLLAVSPLAAMPDIAQPPPYANRQLSDPAREAAARELMHELRCLTCQSQSIADSDAPMAQSMRHEVRQQIGSGQTTDEVRDWLVERYGDYVIYEPRLTGLTWPLFVLPVFFAALAAAVAWGRTRRGGSQ
jgi:cytochrome c-type biogenesis protein CcmH